LKIHEDYEYGSSKQLSFVAFGEVDETLPPKPKLTTFTAPTPPIPPSLPLPFAHHGVPADYQEINSNVGHPVKWTFELLQENLNELGNSSETSWWEIDDKKQVHLKREAIQDIWLVCHYSAAEKGLH